MILRALSLRRTVPGAPADSNPTIAGSSTLGTALPVSDSSGACVCPGDSYPVGKSCVLGAVLFPAVFGPALLLALAAYSALKQYWAWLGDMGWRLNRDELEMDDPPEILGWGLLAHLTLAHLK